MIPITLFATLQQIFRDNEPELILLSYSEDHTGIFQLVDCDGYRLGKIICEEIFVLCVTTQWESYNGIEILPVAELTAPGPFAWIKEAAPEDYLLILLSSSNDEEENSALPPIANTHAGYILCKSISFAEETTLGR